MYRRCGESVADPGDPAVHSTDREPDGQVAATRDLTDGICGAVGAVGDPTASADLPPGYRTHDRDGPPADAVEAVSQ
jgi:hypothetical protein